MASAKREIKRLRKSKFYEAYLVAWNIWNEAWVPVFGDEVPRPTIHDVIALLPDLTKEEITLFAKRNARLTFDFDKPNMNFVWGFDNDCTAVGQLLAAVFLHRRDVLAETVEELLQDPVARFPLIFAIWASYDHEPWPIDLVRKVIDTYGISDLSALRPKSVSDDLFESFRNALQAVSRHEDRDQQVQEMVATLLESDDLKDRTVRENTPLS